MKEKSERMSLKSVTNENNAKKRKIPTHLNIHISIPLTNNADKFLKRVKETALKIKKKSIKKHHNLNIENIKGALPIQTEVKHNSSFETTETSNTYFSESTFLNRLDSPAEDHFNSSNTPILDSHKSNSIEILLEKNIECENNENISISKEESLMAGHKTHDQDLNYSKSQTDLNSSVDISVQEAIHEEMSPVITGNHNESMSTIYDVNDIQYTTSKRKKKKIHLNEMPDYKGINAETTNDSTNYGITSCAVKRKQEHILNFEEYSQKDKKPHKSNSKKRKVEKCDEEINYLTSEDRLSIEKVSSKAMPQINDKLEKNIFNLEKETCIKDCLLNNDVSSKSRNQNEKDGEYSSINLKENNTVEKCKSIESSLSETKKEIENQLEVKNKVKELEDVDDILINDSFELQTLENHELNEMQPYSDYGIVFREGSISENVNAKCTIKSSESMKEHHTKKNCKIKGKNDYEGKDKIDKVENTKEKKSKVTKPKLSMMKNDESSDDEQNNLDCVMDFVKNFIEKSPQFKMNVNKFQNITDNSHTDRKNGIKSSNTNKLLSFDSSDGFSSDDSLGGLTKLFSKNSDNKCKNQEIQKSKTKGISKKTKQKKIFSNITVPKEKQQVVNCDKTKDNVTLSETENDVSKKQCQDLREDLEKIHSSRTESSSLNSSVSVIKNNTPNVGKSTGSKLVTGTSSKNTSIKSIESKANEGDKSNSQFSQNKLKITRDNNVTKYFEDKNIKSNNQIQEQNKSSKSSHSVFKQDKQKVKKSVKSKQEILESETSSSSVDTDDEHKKNIKTNQINNQHEEIHLKDNIISYETIMKKIETPMNQESSGSSKDTNNKFCENITKKLTQKEMLPVNIEEQVGNVPKLETTKIRKSSSSSDTDEESEENVPINKLIEKDKLQEKKDSGKAKKLIKNKDTRDISGKELVKKDMHSEKIKKPAKKKSRKDKNDPSEDTDNEESEKKLILNYFDKILKERYNDSMKKLKSSAFVDSDGSSNENSSDMRGLTDFRTDKDSDSDNEETKLKMKEILDRAESDLLSVMEENEELSNLNIQIDWDVHISHTIETRISSCPTAEQRRLFNTLNLKMKTGPYTKVENDTIMSNFNKFCEVHGLKHNPVPFLNFKYGTCDLLSRKQRINFARYIGRGLENRMLFCIYHRFKVIYSTFSKGRFTPEEDAVIKHYMKAINNSKNQFSELSKILKRPRLAIERRYKYLQKDQGKIYLSSYQKFVHCIMEVTQVNEIEELRHRKITDEEWTSVSKILKIDVEKLKLCWMASLYTKLFHDGPIPVDKIMKELINMLDKTKKDDFRQLDWTKLAKSFKGMTRGFLYRLFKRTILAAVPYEMHSNLRHCVVHLKNRYGEGGHIMDDISNITLTDLSPI